MGIVDNFKDLFKLAETVNNIEMLKQLSELQGRVMELEQENRSLTERLRVANEQSDIRSRLRLTDNAYYLDDGKTLDGPFCMRCWDVDGKLVREHKYSNGDHSCRQCTHLRNR